MLQTWTLPRGQSKVAGEHLGQWVVCVLGPLPVGVDDLRLGGCRQGARGERGALHADRLSVALKGGH